MGRAPLLVLLTLAAGFVRAADLGPPLRVCLLTDNLPYSERATATGFDHDIGALVARETGRRFKPIWIDNDRTIQEIESDYPVHRLARAECDAIFSMAGPGAETLGGLDELTLGEPYYGAAFELVACGGEIHPSLRQLRGRSVAIQSQTVAHFALLMVKAEPQNHFSFAEAFDALVRAEADAGLLWGPTWGWRLRLAARSGERLRRPELAGCGMVEGYAPPRALRWNLHVATRKDSVRLRTDIDRKLAEFAATGELDRRKKAYGIPPHAPFETTYTPGAVNDL